MKFEPVSLSEAEGKILGHNIAAASGERLLRKGKPLTQAADNANIASAIAHVSGSLVNPFGDHYASAGYWQNLAAVMSSRARFKSVTWTWH